MTEKMGATLVADGSFQVTVIGYPSPGKIPQGIRTLSLKPFQRLSFARWWARWQAFGLAFRQRPDVFIFSTYELIGTALVLKVLLGTRIIYDVRENYYRNIVHSEGLPVVLRWPLAMLVRFQEKLCAPAIDHFLLAEKGYEQEFRFHRGGWTVIENKALQMPVAARAKDPQQIVLLFSGTLSESSGVFRAIRFAEALHRHHPGVHLTIAGYAASAAVRKMLRASTKGKPFITLIGVDALVPHTEIVSLIQTAHAGIIAYPRLPHTVNSVPTKLFEYLQAKLPIIAEDHWPWVRRFEPCRPFLLTDLENPDANRIAKALIDNTFYVDLPAGANWKEEGEKLLSVLK